MGLQWDSGVHRHMTGSSVGTQLLIVPPEHLSLAHSSSGSSQATRLRPPPWLTVDMPSLVWAHCGQQLMLWDLDVRVVTPRFTRVFAPEFPHTCLKWSVSLFERTGEPSCRASDEVVWALFTTGHRGPTSHPTHSDKGIVCNRSYSLACKDYVQQCLKKIKTRTGNLENTSYEVYCLL